MAGTAELKNLRLFNRIQGPSLPPYHTLSVLKCVIRAANLIGFVCRFFFKKKVEPSLIKVDYPAKYIVFSLSKGWMN